MDDLLNDLIAVDDDEEEERSGMGMLGNILGSLIGGGTTPSQSSPGSGMVPQGGPRPSGPLGSGSLGGGAQSSGMGIGDLLGMLGGGAQTQTSPATNPLTGGLANALAEKLNVSPAVANAVIAAAVGLLVKSVQKRAVQRQAPGEGVALSEEAMEAPELGDVLKTLGRPGAAAPQLATRRTTQQLADQTGIDIDTAERGLQEAFQLLRNTPQS